MNPDLFLSDVLAAPQRLAAVLDAYDGPGTPLDAIPRRRRVLMVGMGSSRFAALPFTAQLRAHGIDAVAELASSELPTAPAADLLAIGISASGSTRETVEALERHRGRSSTVAITNNPDGPLAASADHVLPLHAGPEPGGVACLTYQSTLAVLTLLAAQLTDERHDTATLRPAVDAAAALRDTRAAWLPELADRIAAAHTTYTIAPADRISSALQSALMLREGPRLPADATETGDWLHVDVYLTKRPGYTAVLFPGSRFDAGVIDWAEQRGATVVAVGRHLDGAAQVISIPGSEHRHTALAVETGVAELAAAELWRRGVAAGDAALQG